MEIGTSGQSERESQRERHTHRDGGAETEFDSLGLCFGWIRSREREREREREMTE